jgi:hypothetical protein
MALVFARTTCVTSLGETRVNLTAGEAWDAEDPLVAEHPDLFIEQPPLLRRTHGGLAVSQANPEVEDATARPGEKRSTRRSRSKAK